MREGTKEGRTSRTGLTGAMEETRPVGRPAGILAIVERRTLPERAEKIGEYHQAMLVAGAQAAVYIILCGMELHAARAQIKHGNWEDWVEAHCPFKSLTAWRYMQAAERKFHDKAFLSHVKDLALGMAPHLLPAPKRADLLAAVQDSVRDDTVRQLYLDLGIIKAPAPRGGAHNLFGRAGDPEKLAGKCEAERREAIWFWNQTCAALLTAASKKSYGHLSPQEQMQVAACLGNIAAEIKTAIGRAGE